MGHWVLADQCTLIFVVTIIAGELSPSAMPTVRATV